MELLNVVDAVVAVDGCGHEWGQLSALSIVVDGSFLDVRPLLPEFAEDFILCYLRVYRQEVVDEAFDALEALSGCSESSSSSVERIRAP